MKVTPEKEHPITSTAVKDVIQLLFQGCTLGSRPTVFEVAGQMLMSVRTMQRRLKSESSTFSDLMNDVIAERILYLRDEVATVAKLAEVTGFTDRTGLTVFCRNRFKCNARDVIARKIPGKDIL